LPAVAEAWDELIDVGHPGAIFRSAAWLQTWWRQFSDDKELCIYAATKGTRLIGALPAYRVESVLGGQRLRLLGDGAVTSDYLGVIARVDDLRDAAQAIAKAVLSEERDVLLDGLIGSDPLIDALRRRATTSSLLAAACPYLSIDGQGDFKSWITSRPRGLGAQLQRRRRWLEKQPGFRIDVLTDQAEVAAALPTLWQLHRARWALSGGSRALPDTAVEQFHYESARALARLGWVRIYVLHADGRPRAALYGFERGGRLSYYQMGTDPDWRKRSVGTVILCAALEDAFERGLGEFDFLRGNEQYKMLFSGLTRPVATLRLAAGVRACTSLHAHRAWRVGANVVGPRLPLSVRKRFRSGRQ
jgi:CelD/BcsL family acetyltransferase involved in cellulose biosynthesis